jgi:hypothetical protein
VSDFPADSLMNSHSRVPGVRFFPFRGRPQIASVSATPGETRLKRRIMNHEITKFVIIIMLLVILPIKSNPYRISSREKNLSIGNWSNAMDHAKSATKQAVKIDIKKHKYRKTKKTIPFLFGFPISRSSGALAFFMHRAAARKAGLNANIKTRVNSTDKYILLKLKAIAVRAMKIMSSYDLKVLIFMKTFDQVAAGEPQPSHARTPHSRTACGTYSSCRPIGSGRDRQSPPVLLSLFLA